MMMMMMLMLMMMMMMLMMNGDIMNHVSASLTFDDRFLATLNAWTACSLIYPSSAKKGGRPPNMTSRCNFGYMMCRGVYFEPQSSGCEQGSQSQPVLSNCEIP